MLPRITRSAGINVEKLDTIVSAASNLEPSPQEISCAKSKLANSQAKIEKKISIALHEYHEGDNLKKIAKDNGLEGSYRRLVR